MDRTHGGGTVVLAKGLASRKVVRPFESKAAFGWIVRASGESSSCKPLTPNDLISLSVVLS
jgi:hypothetical protein